MELDGKQLEMLCTAIGKSFDRNDIERMLAERFDEDLDNITYAENERQLVFDIVKEAEKNGWIDKLVHVVAELRPQDARVVSVARLLLGADAIKDIAEAAGSPQPSAKFTPFADFATDVQSLFGWIGKLAVAAPFADLILQVGPPWPPRVAVSLLTAFLQVVMIIVGFQYLRYYKTLANIVLAVALGCALITAIWYVHSFGYRTEWNVAADPPRRVAIGTPSDYSDLISQFQANSPTKMSAAELLKSFHDPYDIWTEESIERSRTLLFGAWIAMWSSVSMALASFVATQWKSERIGGNQ